MWPHPPQGEDDADGKGCSQHRRPVDGSGGLGERRDLVDDGAGFRTRERQAEEVAQLARKDDHCDARSEADRNRIGDELDVLP